MPTPKIQSLLLFIFLLFLNQFFRDVEKYLIIFNPLISTSIYLSIYHAEASILGASRPPMKILGWQTYRFAPPPPNNFDNLKNL